MNGLNQVAMMTKLMNSEQQALTQAWRPANLAGFHIGDAVRLPNIECTFEVVGFADPLLVLKAPSGREVRAGWQAVGRVRTRAEINGSDAA